MFDEILHACERSPLMVGFIHSQPDRKEYRERLSYIRLLCLNNIKGIRDND